MPSQPPTRKRRLAVKIALLSFCIGLLWTCICSSILIYTEYRGGHQKIDDSILEIGEIISPSLAKSIWNLNNDLLKAQLEGLVRMPYISQSVIQNDRGESFAMGDDPPEEIPCHVFPILYKDVKKVRDLGFLMICPNYQVFKGRLTSIAVKVFITQATNAFTFALAAFALFYFLAGRYLERAARQAESLSMANLDTPVSIKNRVDHHKRKVGVFMDKGGNIEQSMDEIDILENALNTMRLNLKTSVRELRNYEHIISSTNDLMSFADKHYIYRAVNNAYIKAYAKTREEIVGHSVESLVGPEQFNMVVQPKFDLALEGEPVSYRTWFEFRGIGRRYINVFYHPFFGADNRVSGVVICVHDLTDIKEAEETMKKMERDLRQARKMESIGTLAGGIAHDFNNILFPIIGRAELMMEDFPKGSSAYTNAKKIFEAGNRAAELVKQILTFSRRAESQMSPISISIVIKEVLKLCRSTIPSNVTIRRTIDDKCGFVMGDITQLHQLTLNLITNAFHAVEGINGNIDVQLHQVSLTKASPLFGRLQPGKYALLHISDNGSGMPPEVLERIFEPYFTTKEQGKGTGLGLALVYGIVQDHGGEIEVSSEEGKGTLFKVFLPIVEKSKKERPPIDKKSVPTGSEKILLVDDEEVVNSMVKQMLERLGYQVTAKNNSVDALRLFESNPSNFDLLLTDMTMPTMTGDELTRAVKEIRPDIPVIICTGFSERINPERVEEIGVEGFLMKPVIRSKLARLLRKVLNDGNREY